MPKVPSEDKLLPREIEILQLLRRYTLKETADKLHISVKTIYKHLENARNRNNLPGQIAVFIMAIEEGYIEPVTPFRRCVGFDPKKNSKIFINLY